MTKRRIAAFAAGLMGIAFVAVALVFATNERLRERVLNEKSKDSLAEFAKDHGSVLKWHQNSHSQALAIIREKSDKGGEAGAGPAQELYADQAYPAAAIGFAEQQHASSSWSVVGRLARGRSNNWVEVGPTTPTVAGPANYTGRETTNSGRVTALALSPNCADRRDCRLFVGAAGGGVWATDDALASHVQWRSIGFAIPSNAIGSIYFDPTDATGKTLYVGTGEPNGSGDSEAGIGLFKSTDNGKTWALVPGSVAAAKDRSIAAIAVDPANSKHIWIGTAVARHGSSSVNGGRFSPPGAPDVGLYESSDGGQTFSLAFSRPSDPVDPTSANGGDFFRAGISKIEWDSLSHRIYFSVFDYGLYRQATGGGFERVFTTACDGFVGCSTEARDEFSLAPLSNGKLRIYLGDWDGYAGVGLLYRTDDGNQPASALTDETTATNAGWTLLSDPNPGTPGFGSYDFCGGQCSYDMPVFSPPGQPDTVYIGGQMQYGEIFTATPPSNGRAVQRSTDAGVHFTDMTNDTQSPPLGMHPDQHAMAFGPNGMAFFGSDGGVVRTSGQFADASGQCASRGLGTTDLVDCQAWLSAIPTKIDSLNDGLATLQFQSVAVNPAEPLTDLIGGTQDNGTWVSAGRAPGHKHAGSWFESVGGDGGQAGVDVGNAKIRIHSYYGAQHDVNFDGNNPLGWDWVADPFTEASSFYVPLVTDPTVSGTIFDGLQHVWRTKDSGGDRAFLDQYCNEFFGDYANRPKPCGDWEPIGQDLSSVGGPDKGGDSPTSNYVVALSRSPQDRSTLWAATRRGRVFVSTNADADAANVSFDRIDTAAQPTRFVSGIAIDPRDKYHAWISYSGYNAYATDAGTATGHVFEVRYNPTTHTATWSSDMAGNLGDQPITAIAYDHRTGDLYAGTDFGVVLLRKGTSQWVPAAGNLPPVAVYGLTMVQGKALFAATHGRGIWRLDLAGS